MKLLLTVFVALVFAFSTSSTYDNALKDESSHITIDEEPEDQKLFDIIREKDSLLFQIGFNQIDTAQVVNLTAADFEFYHDEHGITDSKSAFVNNINSIRELPFKTWRVLEEKSMEVTLCTKTTAVFCTAPFKMVFMISINKMREKMLVKRTLLDSRICGF